ncbi:MAG: malate/lactate/ureidoglycolate dehydrogenase [Hyphomicrobiaceae bacterium]
MPILSAERLIEVVSDIFAAAGCTRGEALGIARSLVDANLTGHDSHGVARVPRYVDWHRQGLLVAGQTVETISDTPVLAVLDGQYGFGQTVARQAVEIGVGKCREMGLSAVALRNAGHVGRVGEWAEMAAEAGLVSIHFVNAPQSVMVAPFGGIDRRLSTAPVAIGIPRPDDEPLVLDFATSIVAEGKVLVASQGGKPVPDDALVTSEGKLSGDPRVLYGDYVPGGLRSYKGGTGAIRAFGEHKGSGLAFMCEILAGSLTGTGAADDKRPRWANGMLSFYIDPAKLDADLFLPADVARYIAYVKSARPMQPGGEVLIPGEPERRVRRQRMAEGVPLSEETWAAIMATAASVGLSNQGA